MPAADGEAVRATYGWASCTSVRRRSTPLTSDDDPEPRHAIGGIERLGGAGREPLGPGAAEMLHE